MMLCSAIMLGGQTMNIPLFSSVVYAQDVYVGQTMSDRMTYDVYVMTETITNKNGQNEEFTVDAKLVGQNESVKKTVYIFTKIPSYGWLYRRNTESAPSEVEGNKFATDMLNICRQYL